MGVRVETDDKRRLAAIERWRAKHAAYIAVFGPADKPTAAGAIVLSDLERFARFSHSATSRPLGIKSTLGPVDPYGTLYNLGLQEVVKRIHQLLTWQEEDLTEEEP